MNQNPLPQNQTPIQPVPAQPAATSTNYDIDVFDEIAILRKRVDESKLPQGLREKAQGMIMRLIKMSQKGNFSSEFEPVSEYINWITKIPFATFTQDIIEISDVKKTLDKYNYGLEPVKDRILEFLAVIKLQNKEAQAEQQAGG